VEIQVVLAEVDCEAVDLGSRNKGMWGMVKGNRWVPRVVIGLVLLALVGFGLGLCAAWPGLFPDRWTQGRRAYDRGDWSAAAQSARAILRAHEGDPAALRLLARSFIQMGRDDSALAIYTRRLDNKAIEAEDYLLCGVAFKRRGQEDLALQFWNKALEAEPAPARILDELVQLFCEKGNQTGNSEYFRRHPIDQAALAAERLREQPGWESRGEMMLGTIRVALRDVPGAAESFRRALGLDPKAIDNTRDPAQLRKQIARTFLRVGRPAEARTPLQSILAQKEDPEAAWLLSRAYLQEGDKARAQAAMVRAGSYRADNPLEEEPSPYVGEARCQKCHAAIFRDSLASRHTQTYYRGAQLPALPRPDRPLTDPTDPKVTHEIKEVDGALWAEARAGDTVVRSLIEYAFGTSDRYVTMVSHNARDQYHIVRLSYYRTAEGEGWDRTILDVNDSTRAGDFEGRPVSVCGEVVKCLYCHITFPRAGRERIGPETADRAIGCERCHGPGAHHLTAIAAGFSDLAIVNPVLASPRAVTSKQCNDCHILDRNYKRDDRENPYWVRSQGVGWIWSRCNTESGGAFGCVTCHDPHKGARPASAAQYEAKCLACHSATTAKSPGGFGPSARATTKQGSRACPVDPEKGCIQCHMPVVRTDSSHLDLTDHYIRIRRPSAAH
jgi:tetratricopeptide (TPR) repeat protein